MATDKTEPPVGRIATIGVLSIVIVVSIQFVLRSYFFTMIEAEEHRVVLDRPSELLQRTRTEQDEHLRTGRPMPVDQAMASIAHGERPAAIEPRQSDNLDAMHGWGMMPRAFDPTPVAGPGQQAPAQPLNNAVPADPQPAPPVGVLGVPVVAPTVAPSPVAPAPVAAQLAPAPPVAPAPEAAPAPTAPAAVRPAALPRPSTPAAGAP